ncbi:peptidylprolyl isomerase [Aquabacterium sp. OR-4]|uniref:peptidylprolyl isomerase n=1 Tax=Aquabacterium sp. OR-4 TaxID=2978127 RepID=UPI0021B29451|nr:peptidylprolyl isomerase [Aquabacterium sp. OR-4]MDT7833870.1 peptidylprolyl isomerase [Aquabacterium sp. OR-4]
MTQSPLTGHCAGIPAGGSSLRLLVGALALAGCLAAPAALAQAAAARPGGAPAAVAERNSRSGDFIVAVVNTELVTSVEVGLRLGRAQAELRRQGGQLPAEDALRQQAVEALIDERVQVTYARDSGSKVDDAELDRAVTNVAAQNQITVPQLRERLNAEGMDWSRFRANLRDQLLVERLREREVINRIRITDTDIDKLLDEQRARLAGDVQLNLAQILVKLPEAASESVVAERRAIAMTALQRLQRGEAFAQVARELSEDGNREAGGELGLRPADRLPDLFVESVKGIEVGQVTPAPVRSAAGFHLLKVVDRRTPDFYQVTQTHARHVLLRVGDATQQPAVLRRMEDLRRQIESGARKFEDVAREVSEDGSAANGGDLGWAAPGQFVPEFEDAMNKLAPGALSAPVVSRFGVHLLRVDERRNVTLDPKEVREQARNQLREAKFEQAYADWVKELRMRAYIEMREPPL